MHAAYFELYRMKTERHWLRQKLVAYARQHGIKAAPREFRCSRNTVRKWLRRHQPGRPSSLAERSKRPHHCPHQTAPVHEGVIVRLRRQTGFGAERLHHEFRLRPSVGAIPRILRQHGLVTPRPKKHARKKQLRHLKQTWPLFGPLVADTKSLQDIPHDWPQMTRLRLPRFQYTVREVVSGRCFTGYADELSKTYTTLLAERVSAHLAWHGIELRGVTWQTDNGSAFQENQQQRGLPAVVRALGSDHRSIPPKAYTWQSDVETVHRLVEDEFFDRECLADRAPFWAKVRTYWHYFNLARPNGGKEWQTPLQILQRAPSHPNPALAMWTTIDLTALHSQYFPRDPRGHDLPVDP
ncbi:MAG: helix-turn-helix domain containing protein [Verrucomicrobia bacterium]|nr:helix-turn-helix domain containing protein [Verrucomicrobiota bacterium]